MKTKKIFERFCSTAKKADLAELKEEARNARVSRADYIRHKLFPERYPLEPEPEPDADEHEDEPEEGD